MEHEKFLRRCLHLAELGAGNTAPNPMVGALLACQGEIIGEGYHKAYGGPHAEVECIRNVPAEKRHLIGKSTLYVSLEPCNHFGKTPPCTDLIIENKIPAVVIGCRDSSAHVNGKGIQRLKDAGIEVISGVLEKEAEWLNCRFFTFHSRQRPYVILKWAQSADGIMGATDRRLKISNEISDRQVHKWRSEESAIMVGTETARLDNPLLTVRLWPGKNPVRIVIDKDCQLSKDSRIFNSDAPTWVFNYLQEDARGNISYIKLEKENEMIPSILHELHKRNILSLLVEGGARTLDSFIRAGMWDEARVIVNTKLKFGNGIKAPVFSGISSVNTERFGTDEVRYYIHQH